jgi:hypothetical protein
MKFAAWYAILVGMLMLGQWGFFLAAGQVPELHTEPWRIAFHLAAEGLTAVGLLASGLGLLKSRPWGGQAFLLAAGMLLYSLIVSPGYFAQQRQWPLVGMFAALLALAVFSVARVLKRSPSG